MVTMINNVIIDINTRLVLVVKSLFFDVVVKTVLVE